MIHDTIIIMGKSTCQYYLELFIIRLADVEKSLSAQFVPDNVRILN